MKKKTHKKPRRQHYVPQAYLSEFTVDGLIWVYDKTSGRRFQTSTREVAQEGYFYSDTHAEMVEQAIGQLEGMFSRVLKKLKEAKDLAKLTEDDKNALATFAAFQFLRTKDIRLSQEEAINSVLRVVTGSVAPDYEATISDESLRSFHLSFALESLPEFAALIRSEMHWVLFVNDTPEVFWTSDNPCSVYNEFESESFGGNLGFKCKGFQMHIPISPGLLLFFMNNKTRVEDFSRARTIKDERFKAALPKSRIGQIPISALLPPIEKMIPERVIFENNLQLFSSTRFLFSSQNNFSMADKYLAENPRFKDPDRQRSIVHHGGEDISPKAPGNRKAVPEKP